MELGYRDMLSDWKLNVLHGRPSFQFDAGQGGRR
jgi:hypothetical protein